MAVPDWSQTFTLTNPFNGSMQFNVQTDSGIYLLDEEGCDWQITVRAKDAYVPQAPGSILRQRFLSGTSMPLRINLMLDEDEALCGSDRDVMLRDLIGALRSLLNAGDNEGRLAWAIDSDPIRMLDDIRLLSYPKVSMKGGLCTVDCVIDSEFPYAQDLTQLRTQVPEGVPVDITNTGSADYYPVLLVNMLGGVVSGSAVSNFTVQNLTTGEQLVFNASLPGAQPISAGGHWGEVNTFKNTFYEDGSGADLLPGVDELNSEYGPLLTGEQTVMITGCDMDVLWAPAYG